MQKDQRELLLAFNAAKIRYLIVGGHAFSHYAEPRTTKDLDLFIEPSPENCNTIYAVLVKFGDPLIDTTPETLRDPNSGHQIGIAPYRIDILNTIDAVPFEEAWATSTDGMIDGDIPVRYIGVDALIKNKLAVGRLRDLADVEDLQNSEEANRKNPSGK